MCGRYAFFAPADAIATLFEIEDPPEIEFSYNVAPTDYVPAVRYQEGARRLSMLRWGLIPFWAKNKQIGVKMINARAETVSEKPAYKSAFKQRRCLLPASGFFEWQKTSQGKQPHFISLSTGEAFAFAGIWESWGKDEEKIESVSIITTQPNPLVAQVHDRMPVIVPKDYFAKWLGEESAESGDLKEYLVPYPENEMRFYPVGKAVGNPRNKTQECIAPLESDSLF
ncbi:MAG: SOS response-associated peptidase [Pseudomonadota bacterium]